jgi:hypothetical protein
MYWLSSTTSTVIEANSFSTRLVTLDAMIRASPDRAAPANGATRSGARVGSVKPIATIIRNRARPAWPGRHGIR